MQLELNYKSRPRMEKIKTCGVSCYSKRLEGVESIICVLTWRTMYVKCTTIIYYIILHGEIVERFLRPMLKSSSSITHLCVMIIVILCGFVVICVTLMLM